MQLNIEQTVLEKLRGLPLEGQQKVLEFVEEMERQSKPHRSILELAQESFRNVPAEDLAEIPTDAALNLDHYLYGAPKK